MTPAVAMRPKSTRHPSHGNNRRRDALLLLTSTLLMLSLFPFAQAASMDEYATFDPWFNQLDWERLTRTDGNWYSNFAYWNIQNEYFVIYGGGQEEYYESSTMVIYNVAENTFQFREFSHLGVDPCSCDDGNTDYFMLGGRITEWKTLDEVWVLNHNDTYEFTWTQITTTGPKPPSRFGAHCWFYEDVDAGIRGIYYMSGGYYASDGYYPYYDSQFEVQPTFLEDMWFLDLNTQIWTCIYNHTDNATATEDGRALPDARVYGTTFQFDKFNNYLYLFGGRAQHSIGNDLWVFTIDPGNAEDHHQWRLIEGSFSSEWEYGDVPPRFSAGVWVHDTSAYIIHGGKDVEVGRNHRDIWKWTVDESNKRKGYFERMNLDDSVSGRRHFASFYTDEYGYIFGGVESVNEISHSSNYMDQLLVTQDSLKIALFVLLTFMVFPICIYLYILIMKLFRKQFTATLAKLYIFKVFPSLFDMGSDIAYFVLTPFYTRHLKNAAFVFLFLHLSVALFTWLHYFCVGERLDWYGKPGRRLNKKLIFKKLDTFYKVLVEGFFKLIELIAIAIMSIIGLFLFILCWQLRLHLIIHVLDKLEFIQGFRLKKKTVDNQNLSEGIFVTRYIFIAMVAELFLESIPQFILQIVNNELLSVPWSVISILSTTMSAYMVCHNFYEILYVFCSKQKTTRALNAAPPVQMQSLPLVPSSTSVLAPVPSNIINNAKSDDAPPPYTPPPYTSTNSSNMIAGVQPSAPPQIVCPNPACKRLVTVNPNPNVVTICACGGQFHM